MPVDASIYSQLAQQRPMEGPLDQFGRAMQVKNLMGAGQMQDLQLQEMQRATSPEARTLAAQDAALKRRQGEATALKTEADAASTQSTVFGNKLRQSRDLIAQARGDQDMPFLREQITALLGPQFAARIPERFDTTWQQSQIVGADDVLKNLEAQRNRDVTIRGQNVTAQTTRRGQDLTNARAIEAQAQGRIPPGYRMSASGNLEAIPGGPADVKSDAKALEVGRTLASYKAARDGLIGGLSASSTGPVAGRIPAFTTEQQVAEGGVSAMAPVLKQLFRVAGEGVFTDRDQALLLDMVPKRTDTPEARRQKMANIDNIVAAKLGVPVESVSATTAGPLNTMRSSGIRFLGFD